MMKIKSWIASIALLLAFNEGINVRVFAIPNLSIELESLRQSLEKAGFIVKFEKPPAQGTYGLFNVKKKTIWIAPITKEMGIFKATFVHEAVHAAQTCKTGKLEPIGWNLKVDSAVETAVNSILYRNYPSEKFEIEREAFLMQGQKDAVEKLKAVFKKNC